MMTQTTIQTGKGGPRLLVGITVLTLLVAAGTVVRLTRQGDDGWVRASEPAVAATADPEAATGEAQARQQAEAERGREAVGSSGTRIYYLVGTAAQVERVERALAEEDAIRASLGEGPLSETVLLLGSAAEEARFWWAIDQADTLRQDQGMPAFRVIDLRGTQSQGG